MSKRKPEQEVKAEGPRSEPIEIVCLRYIGVAAGLTAVALTGMTVKQAQGLAAFFRDNPAAPPEAGVIELRRWGLPLDPDGDQRRVLLAVSLFRQAVAGLDAIAADDAAAAATVVPQGPAHVPEHRQTFRKRPNPFGLSAFGRAMLGKPRD
jgi:hypothetical protein